MNAWNDEGDVAFSAWDRAPLEGGEFRSGEAGDGRSRRVEKSEDLLRGTCDAGAYEEGDSCRAWVDMGDGRIVGLRERTWWERAGGWDRTGNDRAGRALLAATSRKPAPP